MSPSPADLVEKVFSTVLEETDDRQRLLQLQKLCGDDRALRQRVESLLSAHGFTEKFLQEPIVTIRDTSESTLATTTTREPIGEQSGDQIGAYHLIEEIGQGGMGVVFKAQQQTPVRRQVAIKIVRPGLDTQEVIARFDVEKQALALMDHPNIARVIDGGTTTSGRPFFVMELVEGVSVTEYCDQNRLTTQQRLELFIPICNAVQHAHQKGIIHRDIKPSNVMVTMSDGSPVPKIIDFGIAKATDRSLTGKTPFTRHGEFIGTPAYMSPEQAKQSGMDVDTRSDVYSLGSLLYEMLTGVPSIASERLDDASYGQVLSIIRTEDAPRPSAVLNTIGDRVIDIADQRRVTPERLITLIRGELDWIVLKAMDKDRTRRYQTAGEMGQDIVRYLQDDVIQARPPSSLYRLRKFVRRNRSVVASVAGIVFVLIVTSIVGAYLAWRALTAEGLATERLLSERTARQAAEASNARAVAAEVEAAAEAQNASREAAISQAVLEFLNRDILAQAGPDGQPLGNVTLRTVLDRASKKVESRFDNEPAVEAKIREVLGDTYAGYGEDGLAAHHLWQSWTLHRQLFGDNADPTLSLGNRLAHTYLNQGEHRQAAELLVDLLKRSKTALGEVHPTTLAAMTLSAELHEAKGELDEAHQLHASVLNHWTTRFGSSHPETLMAMNHLARSHQARGDLAQAEQLLDKAWHELTLQQGEWHPQTMKVMNNLASVYLSQGRTKDAEMLYRNALQEAKQTLGIGHPQTLTLMNSLALCCYEQGLYPEAEELYLTSMLVAQTERPETLATKHNLAALYHDQGRFQKAEQLYSETWEQRRRVLGQSHVDTLTTLNNFAFFYLDRGRHINARDLYELTTVLVPEAFGEHHENSVVSFIMLGLCELKCGQFPAAERALHEAKRRCSLALEGHWLQFVIDSMLAEVLLETGRLDESETLLKAAYQGLKPFHGALPERWKRFGFDATTRRLAKLYELKQAAIED